MLVLTNNRSLTQFFRTKFIHPSLMNCLDKVLLFNILPAHVPGKTNSAADFLSRMQTDSTLTLSLKLSDRRPIQGQNFPETIEDKAYERLIS